MHRLVFLVSAFTSVVQVTGVRMYHDQALYKEPHGGKKSSSQQEQKLLVGVQRAAACPNASVEFS